MSNSKTVETKDLKGLASSSSGSILRWSIIAVVYVIAYAGLEWAASLFRMPNGTSPWYPAAGLGLALLAGFGVSYAPVFFLGVLVSDLWLESAPMAWSVTLVSVLLKTLSYVLGALLLRYGARIDPQLRRWKDAVWLLVVAVFTPLLGGGLAAWNLTAAGVVPHSEYLGLVGALWIGDAIGIVVLSPFLLRVVLPWVERLGDRRRGSADGHRRLRWGILEGLAYAGSIVLVLWTAFGSPLADRIPPLYILFVPLLIIGLRHGLPGATSGILALNVGMVLAARGSSFPFESVGELQMFMLALSLGGLALGIVVSRQRRAHAALRRSERRYRALYNRAPVMLQTVGSDGRITGVNDYWLEEMGYEREQVVGCHCSEFLTEASRRYAEEVAGPACHKLDRVEKIPYQYVKRDGERIDTLLSAAWERDEEGEPVCSLEALIDVTELKRAERALLESEVLFRRTFEAIPDPAILWRRHGDGRITLDRGNPAAFLLSGGRITHFLDRSADEFFEEVPRAAELVTHTFETGKTQRVELHHRLRAIDEERWLLADYVRASQNYVLNIIRDISERKQAEVERERLIAELDAFAHTVAHDLKGPLAMVLGYSTVLMENFVSMPPEELQRYLRALAASGRRMSNIIDELLLLAGVRRREAVELTPLNMGHIAQDVQARLTYLIEKSQATIILPESWPQAIGHAPWVEEVWANFISNAIQYGGDPPRVELGGRRLADGFVRFWVRDNGQGLSEEEQSQLLASFTQLHQVRADGHGLGLSIAHRIVEKLGGEVGVESEIGQGSVFWFALPGVPDQDG
ncbi:MAG: PAS domain S-box protein [Anaerolineae bacterium]|jgi:PAS domain S-box-containing protein